MKDESYTYKRKLLVETWTPLSLFRGKKLMEAGYIFAPYIPMQTCATIIREENWEPKKGIATRYAENVINNRYYRAVTLR